MIEMNKLLLSIPSFSPSSHLQQLQVRPREALMIRGAISFTSL